MHVKTLKSQTEKDAKCILDLNRQIKEMERIIARKHPDSVSALIVASKNDPSDGNLSARKVLEDRIKSLEQEVATKEAQSAKIFLEVQEKFNVMKSKYDNHIEDLELHVKDLKNQLRKNKIDTFDVYAQTFFDEQKIPQKDMKNIGSQTEIDVSEERYIVTNNVSEKLEEKVGKKLDGKIEYKGTKQVDQKDIKFIDSKYKPTMNRFDKRQETHLLATLRGLQADLSNKEKVILKLQKEIDELKKTNRRLQKEREGSLRNLSEKKEFFRSYPEKLSQQTGEDNPENAIQKLTDELKAVRSERDKMKSQLCRIEDDYQLLKTKRIQDLTALQEAHEKEMAGYLASITPLREQLEVQQVTISTLQNQLSKAKEELAIITVERDHLNNRVNSGGLGGFTPISGDENNDIASLKQKVGYFAFIVFFLSSLRYFLILISFFISDCFTRSKTPRKRT